MKLMRRFVLCLILPILPSLAYAQVAGSNPVNATVRIKSHGGSGTVIASMPGRSWILSCAHMFTDKHERPSAEAQRRRIVMDGQPQPYAAKILASPRLVAVDYKADLSLIVIDNGPFYSIPIAQPGHRPSGKVWSCGYDEMKWPITARQASIIGSDASLTYTRESPWHGRSGGCLADAQSGALIGVVHGYETGPGRPIKGLYISHTAVLKFLSANLQHFPQEWQPALQASFQLRIAPQTPYIPPAFAPHLPQRPGVIDIHIQNRVPNRTGSQCVWSSLETLARHHQITRLYDLTQKYHGVSGPGQVAGVLKSRGVRFKQSTSGTATVKDACAQGFGCMIGLSGSHAIVACGADQAGVQIIDNCGPLTGRTQTWTWSQFGQRFDGWAVVLYPDGRDEPRAQIQEPQQQFQIQQQLFQQPQQPHFLPPGQACPS